MYRILKFILDFVGMFVYFAECIASVFLGYKPLWFFSYQVWEEHKLRRFR